MPQFVLIKPIFSEKAVNKAAAGVYTFQVGKKSNKTQIKKAVEDQFGVKVAKVAVANFKPETKIQGRHYGQTKAFKKAIVKVKEGTINLWAPPDSVKATSGKPGKKEKEVKKE